MDEKELSPQESLDLINSMIGKARKRYTDNSFYFLLWGWLTIAASALHYYFAVSELIDYPSMAWLLMIVGAIVSMVYGMRQEKRASVTHYTDKLYGWLWLSLGVAMVIVIMNGQFLNFQIVPLMLLITGVGTFFSGAMMRFKVLQSQRLQSFGLDGYDRCRDDLRVRMHQTCSSRASVIFEKDGMLNISKLAMFESSIAKGR